MAKWMHVLRLSDLAQSARDRQITPMQYAEGVTNRLKWLLPSIQQDYAQELEDIIDNFECFSSDDWDDLDNEMSLLYDWADTSLGNFRKLCWVETSV